MLRVTGTDTGFPSSLLHSLDHEYHLFNQNPMTSELILLLLLCVQCPMARSRGSFSILSGIACDAALPCAHALLCAFLCGARQSTCLSWAIFLPCVSLLAHNREGLCRVPDFVRTVKAWHTANEVFPVVISSTVSSSLSCHCCPLCANLPCKDARCPTPTTCHLLVS